MRRGLRRAAPAVLTCLFLSLGWAAAVNASIAYTPAPGTVLLSDDFSTDTVGQPPAGWVAVSGTWAVAVDGTNVLKQTATDTATSKSIFTGATSGAAAWTDYSAQVQLKPGTTNYSLGYTLNARYQDDDNSYSLVLKSGNSFYFGKKVAGVWTTFSSGSFVYNTATWYALEIDAAGTSVRALINGKQVGSVNDSSFSAGAVDLMARYTGEFSNVVVTQLAPPPPPPPSPSPSPKPSPSPSPSSSPSPSASPSASPRPSPSPLPSPSPSPTPTNPGTINGVIVDRTGGTAIAGAAVTAQPGGVATTTDATGAYQLSLPQGTYSVLASASGYNSDFAGAVPVTSGAVTTANVSLPAVPGYESMDLFSRPDQSGVGTASDGNTWLDDRSTYPTATASIVSRHLFVQTATAWTDLDQWMGYQYADEEVTVDLNMARGNGRVLARVQNASTWVEFAFNVNTSQLQLWTQQPGNRWNAFATVNNFVLQQNVWYHAKVDVVGSLVSAKIWPIGTAEPGWQISGTETGVAGPGMGGLRTAVADTYYANFAVTPLTQIGGVVTDSATGKPIAGASVSLSNGSSATTDATGAYAFGGLPPGSYAVTFAATGYGSASANATISIGSGATVNVGLVSTSPPPPPSPSPPPGPSPSPSASPSPGAG